MSRLNNLIAAGVVAGSVLLAGRCSSDKQPANPVAETGRLSKSEVPAFSPEHMGPMAQPLSEKEEAGKAAAEKTAEELRKLVNAGVKVTVVEGESAVKDRLESLIAEELVFFNDDTIEALGDGNAEVRKILSEGRDDMERVITIERTCVVNSIIEGNGEMMDKDGCEESEAEDQGISAEEYWVKKESVKGKMTEVVFKVSKKWQESGALEKETPMPEGPGEKERFLAESAAWLDAFFSTIDGRILEKGELEYIAKLLWKMHNIFLTLDREDPLREKYKALLNRYNIMAQILTVQSKDAGKLN